MPEQARQPFSSPVPDEDSLRLAGFTTIGKGRIQLKLDCAFKTFFTGMLILGFTGLCIVFFDILAQMPFPMDSTTRGSVFFISALLIVFSIALDRVTEGSYVVDLNQRILFFHFRFLSWEGEKPNARFEEFLAVTSQSSVFHSRCGPGTWDYRTALVLHTGRAFPVSNWHRHLPEVNVKARTLAKLLGCPYHAGREKQELQIERDRDTEGYRSTHTPPF